MFGAAFSYTPTSTDEAMVQVFIERIEEISTEDPQKFESLKSLLPLLVEQSKTKPKSYYIFSSLYKYFIGWLDEGEQTNSNLVSVDVVRVVDWDTIIVDYFGEEERVRLIWVDTPESVHPTQWVDAYWIEASEYTKGMLENKSVELEFDVQERDQYGRLLAYVWIDGAMFNKTLLSEGYGYASTWAPNVKYTEEFKALESQAFEQDKGLRQLEEYASTQSVNINTATLEQLTNIIHIDMERAQQIINIRPFDSVEWMVAINGIWPARLADILEEWVATIE